MKLGMRQFERKCMVMTSERGGGFRNWLGDSYPKGPCTHIVYTLALKSPKYLYRDSTLSIYYLGTWTLRVCVTTDFITKSVHQLRGSYFDLNHARFFLEDLILSSHSKTRTASDVMIYRQLPCGDN